MDISVNATYTDEQLLTALRNDNSQALGIIYERYYQHIYHFLLTVIKDPHAAEDLTHEVFIKIWDIRHQLKIEKSFKSYLLKIGHNKAIDLLRKISSEEGVKMQLPYYYQAAQAGESFSQEELDRFQSLMDQALDSLTPHRRKLYELCKTQKKSYAEVAKELNISLNTVKAHMGKILSLLREFIYERWQFSLLFLLLKKFL